MGRSKDDRKVEGGPRSEIEGVARVRYESVEWVQDSFLVLG